MGFSVVPPAYPTRVRITPLRLPNRESGPQNQPRANVAVSVSTGAAASIGGIVCFGIIVFSFSAVSVVLQPIINAGNKKAISRNDNNSLVIIYFSHSVISLFICA